MNDLQRVHFVAAARLAEARLGRAWAAEAGIPTDDHDAPLAYAERVASEVKVDAGIEPPGVVDLIRTRLMARRDAAMEDVAKWRAIEEGSAVRHLYSQADVEPLRAMKYRQQAEALVRAIDAVLEEYV